MATFRVQASSVVRVGEKVGLMVRFRSSDAQRASPLQYFEVESTTVRGVEDALKQAAREWESRVTSVTGPVPSIRTGVDISTDE